MKVLGILGSPRKDGNTEILLDRALAGAKAGGAETEKVVLNELKFRPCQECGGCDATGECVIRDDMQGLYRKIEEADVLIVASPIFFGSLSAQTKAMIDRHQCRWVRKYVLKQPAAGERSGLFLAAGATDREDFFANARSIVKNFFATVGVSYRGGLFCPRIDKKGEINNHPELLEKAFILGEELVDGKL